MAAAGSGLAVRADAAATAAPVLNASASTVGGCTVVGHPTSSASISIELTSPDTAPCFVNGTRFTLLARKMRGEYWETLEQLGPEGRELPMEIGGLHCRDGCFLRLCALNGTQIVNVCIDLSSAVQTPLPLLPLPRLDLAARIELVLHPPLHMAARGTAHAWSKALSSVLGFNQQQFVAAEVSNTGSFLLLDIVPQDVYHATETLAIDHRVSGKHVPNILQVLVERVHSPGGLSVLGHTVDSGVGVWRQVGARVPSQRLLPAAMAPPPAPAPVSAPAAAAATNKGGTDPVPYVILGVGLFLVCLIYPKMRRLLRKEGELRSTITRLRERAAYTGLTKWEDLDMISKVSYGLNL